MIVRLRLAAAVPLSAFLLAASAPPAAPDAAVSPVPTAAWPADDAGLAPLAASLLKDWMSRTSVPALQAAMLPCFQLLTYQGSFDRDAGAAHLAALGAASPAVSDIVATRVGDTLVVTCMLKVGESAGGRSLPSDPSPRLGVWQRADGAWKLAAWASLNMPPARPAPGSPSFTGDAALAADGSGLLTRLLGAQHRKELDAFGGMLADGLQVINFKGQKARKDIVRGAEAATTDEPKLADARVTRCGDLTVVTCTLTMGQKIGFTRLPADPAPFMAVFQGTGDKAKAVAMANTNRPK